MSKVFATILLGLLISACSTSEIIHQYAMRGQVVQVTGDQVVVCTGTSGAFNPGEEYDAFEVVFEGSIDDGTDSYYLKKVGSVALDTMIDTHFARGKIIDGAVSRHNELIPRK